MTERLRLKVSPREGESLLGFLGRTAKRNVISIETLHRMAGAKPVTQRPPPGNLPLLAGVTGTDPSVLAQLSYRPAGSGKWYRLGDLDLPGRFFNTGRKRVCVDCLSESAYHRKIWDLRIVLACPVHCRLLVTTCPDCARDLRWSGVDPWRCSYCGTDLFRARPSSVPPDGLRGTRFVYGVLRQPGFMEDAEHGRSCPPFSLTDEHGALSIFYILLRLHGATCASALNSPEGITVANDLVNDIYDACLDWPSRLPELACFHFTTRRAQNIGALQTTLKRLVGDSRPEFLAVTRDVFRAAGPAANR